MNPKLKHGIVALFLCFAISSTTACGPRAVISSQYQIIQPKYLALLPFQTPAELSQARQDYLRQSLRSELSNANFYLLDDRLVAEVCSNPICPERNELIKRYPIAAFASLDLQSNSENDFLLGYYNQISGEFFIRDIETTELVKVQSAVSKKGGLVFQSGQVLQGLRESYQNYSDAGFKSLADNFVKEIVEQIPEDKVNQTNSRPADDKLSEVKISAVTVDSVPEKSMPIKICLLGTSFAQATLVLGPNKANLREVNPGNYCGIYLLDLKLKDRAAVELSNAFGVTVRAEVPWQ